MSGLLAWLDLTDRFLDQLSGGQRQRAFMAKVLAQKTDYTLLDEPLNKFDVKNARAIMLALRTAVRALNKTVVMVLHDINCASVCSDRFIAMQAGRVIREASVSEIHDRKIEALDIESRRFAVYYGALLSHCGAVSPMIGQPIPVWRVCP